MKLFHLIPRLNPYGAGRQLVLLATGLPRPAHEQHVAVLADAGPLAEELKAAGITVQSLPRRRLFDTVRWWTLRESLRRFQPDLIHVWGRDALSLLRLATGWRTPPLLLSCPLVSRTQPGVLDRWLLRRVARVHVHGDAEAHACIRLGIEERQIMRIAPAVASVEPSSLGGNATIPKLPVGGRCVACIGELNTFIGFRDALWAFDILRFLYPELQILLVGDGPCRPQLEAFVRNISGESSIHFLGEPADPSPLLARAEVVWVADGSVSAALAAMASSRPVVTWQSDALAGMVSEGETGFLVPPGRQAELARATRLLLDNTERCREMGEAGRRRAQTHFTPAELVRNASVLYQEL